MKNIISIILLGERLNSCISSFCHISRIALVTCVNAFTINTNLGSGLCTTSMIYWKNIELVTINIITRKQKDLNNIIDKRHAHAVTPFSLFNLADSFSP